MRDLKIQFLIARKNMNKISRKLASTIAAISLAASIFSTPTPVSAQLGPLPYIGELLLFAGNFCPRNYASANGQLLQISSNTALFSLYGTTYGGDGRTTFGVPDLQGRTPIHVGSGPGLPTVSQGSKIGSAAFTLTQAQMPAHNHTVNAAGSVANNQNPQGDLLAGGQFYSAGTATLTMSSQMISNAGNSQSVNKRSPIQVIRYCVATQGIYPSRN